MNIIARILQRRAAKRLEERKKEITAAIAYSERQIEFHRARIDELFVEKGGLDADLLTLDLPARRAGGPLARLGVPCSGAPRS
jgi:hypothetical protein